MKLMLHLAGGECADAIHDDGFRDMHDLQQAQIVTTFTCVRAVLQCEA